MPYTEEELQMIQSHEKIIHEDVLPRLKLVEDAQADFQRAQASLELTVMKDGQETRGLLNRFVDHHFGLDKDKMASNERITLKRFSTREKIWIVVIGGIAGSGGLIAAIATLVTALK